MASFNWRRITGGQPLTVSLRCTITPLLRGMRSACVRQRSSALGRKCLWFWPYRRWIHLISYEAFALNRLWKTSRLDTLRGTAVKIKTARDERRHRQLISVILRR